MRSERRTRPRSRRTSASESSRVDEPLADPGPRLVVRVDERPGGGRAGQQDADLLEDLADRGSDIHLGLGGRAPEPLRPLRRCSSGPREPGIAVARVDPTAREDVHARRERHPRHALEHEHLRPGRGSASLAATCVPLSFMGKSLGVLHATSPSDVPFREVVVASLETLAFAAATRTAPCVLSNAHSCRR